MFEVNGVEYDLKFNVRKQDEIEKVADVSIMAEFNKTSGLLSLNLLRTMFTAGLVEAETGKPVKGKKALDLFDEVLENNGYQGTVNATLNKFTEDMGFLFR